jgi:nickel superoxide dismutase
MKHITILMAAASALGWAGPAAAHCEIPCGIYGDDLRIEMMREDIATIEKSMREIERLGAEGDPSWNQLVRWISNKEQHAEKVQQEVAQYWLHQRIKPVGPDDEAERQRYLRRLEILHQILFHAMKAKQTTDLAQVGKLRRLVDEFTETYFSPEQRKHLESHGR